MFVEALGGFIFCIHEESKYTQLGTRCSQNCIREESSTQSLAL